MVAHGSKEGIRAEEAVASLLASRGFGDRRVREAEWLWQTHAYLIWPAAATLLLSSLPVDAPVDVFLSRHVHTRAVTAMVVDPPLAWQADDIGDVEVRDANLERVSSHRGSEFSIQGTPEASELASCLLG